MRITAEQRHEADRAVTQHVAGIVADARAALEAAAVPRSAPVTYALPGYRVAAETVGGAAIEDILFAFSHLREAVEGAPDGPPLRWSLCDLSAASIPPAPGLFEPEKPYGTFHLDEDTGLVVERRRRITTLFDQRRGELVSLFDGAHNIDRDFRAKPLLRFLIGMLLPKGFVTTHAALVGDGDRGLAITGRGGAGKSTLSAACLEAGLRFCGDDFIAIAPDGDGAYRGHSLFGTIMMQRRQLAHFPSLSPHAATDEGPSASGKDVVSAATLHPDQMARSLRIVGVAVPEIVAEPASSLQRLSRTEVLRALVPFSSFTSPWRERDRISFYFEMMEKLDAFTYRSGSDFALSAEPLRALIAEGA